MVIPRYAPSVPRGGSDMVEAQSTEHITPTAARRFRIRHNAARVMVAGGLIAGVLAVAAPSWAGPLMGC
jgi:hypothetical protein